jgi:hypothetical protein
MLVPLGRFSRTPEAGRLDLSTSRGMWAAC